MSEIRPYRLRILDAMTASLETITRVGSAPYAYDLSGAVFRGRREFGEGDPETMLAVLEPPVEPDQLAAPNGETGDSAIWDLFIQGWVRDDPVHPTDPAHFLLADTKARLAFERKRSRDNNILGMGKQLFELTFGGGLVWPPDEISTKAYFWLPVRLRFVEDTDNPFA